MYTDGTGDEEDGEQSEDIENEEADNAAEADNAGEADTDVNEAEAKSDPAASTNAVTTATTDTDENRPSTSATVDNTKDNNASAVRCDFVLV